MTAGLIPAAPRELSDIIEDATATLSKEMPQKELGFKADEYERIVEILDRRPTNAEPAICSIMWPEHYSCKSSKKRLVEQFDKRISERMKHHLLVSMSRSAGIVDIGGGWAITFKVESHNRPSFIEPCQGTATRIGEIVRDIISMGARPVAVTG